MHTTHGHQETIDVLLCQNQSSRKHKLNRTWHTSSSKFCEKVSRKLCHRKLHRVGRKINQVPNLVCPHWRWFKICPACERSAFIFFCVHRLMGNLGWLGHFLSCFLCFIFSCMLLLTLMDQNDLHGFFFSCSLVTQCALSWCFTSQRNKGPFMYFSSQHCPW